MATATYNLTPTQERALRRSLVAYANLDDYGTESDLVTYGTTTLGYPEALVERVIQDLKTRGDIPFSIEVGL